MWATLKQSRFDLASYVRSHLVDTAEFQSPQAVQTITGSKLMIEVSDTNPAPLSLSQNATISFSSVLQLGHFLGCLYTSVEYYYLYSWTYFSWKYFINRLATLLIIQFSCQTLNIYHLNSGQGKNIDAPESTWGSFS